MNSLILLSLSMGQLEPAVKAVPKLPIGNETTFVTGPVNADGYIDYAAALNDRIGKGITPDKNAVTLLWRAFGPKQHGNDRMTAEYFTRLGIQEPPERGDYLIGLRDYLKTRTNLNPRQLNAVEDQRIAAAREPWSARDYPHLAAWLDEQRKPLDLVIQAGKRPGYFNPVVTRLTGMTVSTPFEVADEAIIPLREAANALTARAFFRVGEGKIDEAWEDLQSARRIGRLIAREGVLWEPLIGFAIEWIARHAQCAFLDKAGLSATQVRKCLKDLQNLPPYPSPAEQVDLGNRLAYLDYVQLIRRGARPMFQSGTTEPVIGFPTLRDEKMLAEIDWGSALRDVNGRYDRVVAIMRMPDRSARQRELDKFDAELAKRRLETVAPGEVLNLLGGWRAPDKLFRKHLASDALRQSTPIIRKLMMARDIAEQQQRNCILAFAVYAYHRDNGQFPADLGRLVPKYVETIPKDLFSGAELQYRPTEKDFLLYSVGFNGVDDGGHPKSDDFAVRISRPLPKRP